ncbi:glycosyltransferase family 4 protein [Candidatus Poribacteria bacterium]
MPQFGARPENMKVLVISHPAIQPTYQRKFEEIARYGDIRLRVVAPDTWFENDQTLHFSGRDASDNLSFHPRKITFPGYGSRFFFTKGLAEHFREFRPDIIHLEEEPWSLCALQTIVLRRLFCPESKLIFRTSLSIPIKLKFGFVGAFIERIAFREFDHAFILSKRAGDLLRQKGYRKGMGISPNGVDTRMFRKMDASDLRENLGIGEKDFVIGYVGRLLHMKGMDTLLEAFAMLDNGRLLLVGSGDYRDEMLSIAARLGISERILLVGSVPAEDVPKYINCMNVLVLPSITTPGWVEFFGRVLAEAMLCRVPVIGSSSGEIPNVIGDAGLVFQEGDAEDLNDKLTMLMQNPELRESLIEKGHERATSLYTWEAIARDTYETYQLLARTD